MNLTICAGISLLPVFIFAAVLVVLDSYKLVRPTILARAVITGCAAAGGCYYAGNAIIALFALDSSTYARFLAAWVEEPAKALFIVYLIRANKVGFVVDVAILSFAVGAGFGAVENIYYLYALPDAAMPLWVARGFGTAIMHGSTTAIFGIISKYFTDRRESAAVQWFLPGLVAGVLLHAAYNQFVLPPLLSAVLLLVVLPPLTVIIYIRSEKALETWLGAGFETDVSLLQIILSGQISTTKVGRYVQSLKTHFPGEVLADMLCLLRLHIELSIRAKGILLLKEAGFPVEGDPEVPRRFRELDYLERSIGATGMHALRPFLHASRRDLWQLHMLAQEEAATPDRP